ncbi:MAG: hypothetical protein ABW250_23815 [Pyrinomonadaceae bacterium]
MGNLLRGWRARRRMSQLDLACEAYITLSELAIESFFPAVADTAAVPGRMAARQT